MKIGVHHADAVVWGPVYRTRLNARRRSERGSYSPTARGERSRSFAPSPPSAPPCIARRNDVVNSDESVATRRSAFDSSLEPTARPPQSREACSIARARARGRGTSSATRRSRRRTRSGRGPGRLSRRRASLRRTKTATTTAAAAARGRRRRRRRRRTRVARRLRFVAIRRRRPRATPRRASSSPPSDVPERSRPLRRTGTSSSS
eukprot:30807-Pelagococcus_subviridis.AAC.5